MSSQTTRAACYIRVSTAAQADEDKDSLRDQAEELLRHMKPNGWQIVEPPAFKGSNELPAGMFGEPGISGDTVSERPGMMALLEAVRRGEVDVVLCRDTNRLWRSRDAETEITRTLRKYRVTIATPNMALDPLDPMQDFMIGSLANADAFAKAWLVRNMARAREHKAQRGGFGQAVRSYGFRWDKGDKQAGRPKRPFNVEHEAQVVHDEMFGRAANGYSVEAICSKLNSQGIRGRNGGRWWNQEVQAILRNPAYMGRFVTWRDPETGEETLADPRLCPPAIVDEATWMAAQAVVHDYRRHRRPWVKRTFLLSGFCTCGVCGRALTIRKPDETHGYYACNHAARTRGTECDLKHIPSAGLDEKVWGFVRSLQDNPEMVKAYARQTTEDLLPKWQRELVRVGEQMKHWRNRERTAREKLETGVYRDEDYQRTKAEYDLHWGDLQAEAAALEEKITHARQERADVDWTAEVLGRAGDLDALDLDGKRRLLSALGVTVTVITVKDEKGRLADVKAKLETYAAQGKTLASAGAMC